MESMGVVEESDVEEDESNVGLQENYNSLLEKSGEYARVEIGRASGRERVPFLLRSHLF